MIKIIKNFFTFRKMVSTAILKFIYILGTFILIVSGIVILIQGGDKILIGLGVIILGNLLWRVICEVLIRIEKTQNHVITTWIAIIALAFSVINLVFYYLNTYPQASIEIVTYQLCIDNRYLEEEHFRDSVYIHLRFINNSFRRPTTVKSIKVHFEDPEDTTIFVQQEFVKKPEYMSSGEGTDCLIKLRLIRLDVDNFVYQLPLNVNERDELNQLRRTLGVNLLVNLQREVKLRFNTIFVGGSKETEFATRFVTLVDVSKKHE